MPRKKSAPAKKAPKEAATSTSAAAPAPTAPPATLPSKPKFVPAYDITWLDFAVECAKALISLPIQALLVSLVGFVGAHLAGGMLGQLILPELANMFLPASLVAYGALPLVGLAILGSLTVSGLVYLCVAPQAEFAPEFAEMADEGGEKMRYLFLGWGIPVALFACGLHWGMGLNSAFTLLFGSACVTCAPFSFNEVLKTYALWTMSAPLAPAPTSSEAPTPPLPPKTFDEANPNPKPTVVVPSSAETPEPEQVAQPNEAPNKKAAVNRSN